MKEINDIEENDKENYFDKRLAESLDNFRMAVNKLDYAITGLMNEVENYKNVSTRKKIEDGYAKCAYCKRIYFHATGYNGDYCSKDCADKSADFSWMP